VTFGRVVFEQPPPQTSGLDANERIGLGIELGWTPKDLDRNRVALETIGCAGEMLLDNEPQKFRRSASCLEGAAPEDTLELRADAFRSGGLDARRTVGLVGR
jgi:hypothetical protein